MTYEDFATTAALGVAPTHLPDLLGLAQQNPGFLHIPGPADPQAGPARLLIDPADVPPSFDFQLVASASGAALLSGAAFDPAETTATTLSSGGTSGGDALLPDDSDPTLTGNDGIDDEETGGDATVDGYRDEYYAGGGTSGGGADGGSDGTGSGDYGGAGGDAETAEQNDCRDRNALAATEEIKAEPDDDAKEHGSIIYIANGQIHHSPPIQGEAAYIPFSAVERWMVDNGVSYSQVIGFAHNHPERVYGGSDEAVRINSYPSDFDWGFADYMVRKGAGSGGSGFGLYIINPDGAVREFGYSSSTYYKNIGLDQKKAGIALPPELKHDGTSC